MPTFIKIADGIYINPDHITDIRNKTISLVSGKTIYVDNTADEIMEILKNGQS